MHLINRNKSVNRKYSKETLLKKLTELDDLKLKFVTASDSRVKNENYFALKIRFFKVYSIIFNKLNKDMSEENNTNSRNMANFSLETSAKLIPE